MQVKIVMIQWQKMKERILLVLLFTLISILIINPSSISAFDMASGYTLPYPPQMPGGIFYKVRVLEERIGEIWNFGSFSKFQYDLALSDRYLVQTKTLIEYQQYLLAKDALIKSNNFFLQTLPQLTKASSEHKDISTERETLRKAAAKHLEVITYLLDQTPETVTWTPEKAKPTTISFSDLFKQALAIRKKSL